MAKPRWAGIDNSFTVFPWIQGDIIGGKRIGSMLFGATANHLILLIGQSTYVTF